MAKETVYIETTIAGHMTSRLPQDPVVAAQMIETRDWWQNDRQNFECYTSELALVEAGRGDPQAAGERIQLLSLIATVPVLPAVTALADLLLARSALPLKSRPDAVHLAIAATSGMTYLLTWNCKHLANATLRAKINLACRDSGFEPPIICTPVELRELRS